MASDFMDVYLRSREISCPQPSVHGKNWAATVKLIQQRQCYAMVDAHSETNNQL
jgi:hypothetical protein